jgi:hypothetical protein
MDWLVRIRFKTLLLTTLALVILHPLLHDSWGARLCYRLLATLVFLAVVPVIFTQRYYRWLAVVFMVPTVLGNWTVDLWPGVSELPSEIVFHTFAGLFSLLSVGLILPIIHSSERISTDDVCGAFCGYLLVAVAFGHFYCLIEMLSAGSFGNQLRLSQPAMTTARLHSHLTYFSLITLTTVGYGDIVPTDGIARSLAAVEAVIGQFYIAMLIAEIIGKHVSQAMAPQPPDTRRDEDSGADQQT